jgi:type I restriction enzyme M protein
LLPRLVASYLVEVDGVRARVAELQAQVDVIRSEKGDEDDEGNEEDPEGGLSDAEVRALRRELNEAKREVRRLEAALVSRVREAHNKLDSDESKDLALGILYDGLDVLLKASAETQVRAVVSLCEQWWAKYRVSLKEIVRQRQAAELAWFNAVEALGYGG